MSGKFHDDCPCIEERVCTKCGRRVCYEVDTKRSCHCNNGYLNPEGLCITCEEDGYE